MKHSLFWAAVEAAAKATRSGLSTVGALVDCGIPRQHAGAQWLTEFEEENEVLEVPLSADFNDEPAARECGGYPCGRCHGETMDWERKILADSGMCPGGWKLREAPVAAAPPENSRTSAGATCNRAVEETSEGASPPAAPSDVLPDSWVAFAIPVIAGVLADHHPIGPRWNGVEPVPCADVTGQVHAEFYDRQDWRDHVSPLIADRLEAVTLALPEM